MGFLHKPPSLFLFIFSLCLLISRLFFCAIAATDTTTLVFKGCSQQKSQDPSGIFSQNLKSFFSSMISQSSQKPFSSTSSGDGGNAIQGLFQCRGDLTLPQCSDCVSKIPALVDKLCGQAVAARVQLAGCYLRYEVAGFRQVSGTELLYKVCGSIQVAGTGFEERRNAAFEMVENGVKNGGALFYTGSYRSLYALGQCQGDLGGGDCGDCLKTAAERANSECGSSISGQIYLNKCYISYSYYPNGIPSISSSSGSGHNTQRTVALAVGGFAALAFLVVCLLFVRSVLMKKRSKHGG
ncbi:cysteine-rich repeat secretory protein 56-like [Momordica charantia]|uniref:Cysteine-rich repeat secretory protein 56-like n=1 Tax=Momordica charantia TaxID=3673 RepID=A0A6J1DQY4_MOMCH|nr:cysteine-rich repeat secretory protein 56-like [Momordica charantia]